METVFVTGGTGFLGKNLVSRLIKRGGKVKVLVRPNSQSKIRHLMVEKVIGDVLEKKTFENALIGVDKIYHLAGVVTDWAPESLYEAVHIQGTKNIIEAAITSGVKKIIHISTVDVLDYEHQSCVDENTKYTSSVSPYRYTKVQAEKLILNSRGSGLEIVIIRPVWIYGKEDTTFFSEIAYQIKKGSMLFIGNPKNFVPLVYIDNISGAIIKAGETEAASGEVFLISDGGITWSDLVGRIASGVGGKKPSICLPYGVAYFLSMIMEGWAKILREDRRPLLTRSAVEMIGKSIEVNTEKAQKILKYKPGVSIDRGILETIQWLKSLSFEELKKKY